MHMKDLGTVDTGNCITISIGQSGRHQAGSPPCTRKEMRKMPWYTNHIITCKVLNRIARRYERSSLHNLKSVLDYATESIWRKQEHYYKTASENRER